MLLIVCPNLCLDRVAVVRDFALGRIHVVEFSAVLASGKGLNVARAARVLGAEVTVVGVIGSDDAGRSIVRGARAHGIRLRAIRVEGPTRVCTLIVDPGRAETMINEPGPAVEAEAARLLMDAVIAGLRRARAVVLAGSLPPGLATDFYAQAIEAARRTKRIPVLLDATGAPLRLGLAARPDLVKVNRTELAEATGRSFASLEDVLAGAEDLLTRLRCHVVVTMAAEGAALVLPTAGGTWRHRGCSGLNTDHGLQSPYRLQRRKP